MGCFQMWYFEFLTGYRLDVCILAEARDFSPAIQALGAR
jgi:hypothetical protein